MTAIKTLGLSALLFAAIAAQAQAHATFVNATVTADSTNVIALQVPHGCDGQATTEVQVKLPEGFVFAKPQPKPGWELEVIKGDYSKTYDNHGKAVTSGPLEIRWKNGSLPEEFYDTFVIQGKVSGIEPGTVLPFVATQLCGADGKVAWDQIAAAGVDPHSLEHPAPTLTVVAKEKGGHGDHAMGAAGMQPATLGDLELTAGFVKAMLPGQPVGGGFITIRNGGGSDDRLVGVTSPAAGRVELHEMAMENDVMKMRKLNDGIAIAAGQTVELVPGGLHLMFMQVSHAFAEGGQVPVTLTFEKAGSVDVVLPVTAAGKSEHKHN